MESESIHIFEANLTHLPAIIALYQTAGITSENSLSIPEAERQFAKLSQYPFYKVFIATIDSKVVGTYELILLDNLAKAGAKSAVVEDVAVNPSIQGRGVGKAMMRHALQLAKDKGAYKLALSSNKKRVQAHAFYEALGFQRHGVSFAMDLAE